MKFHIAKEPELTIEFDHVEDVCFYEDGMSFTPCFEWTDELTAMVEEGFDEVVSFLEEVEDGSITIKQLHQDFKQLIDECLGGLPNYCQGQLQKGVDPGALIEELLLMDWYSPRLEKQKWEAIALIAKAQIK